MLRRALVLVALGAALLAVDRSQRDSAAGARQEALRVRPLVQRAADDTRKIAFVRIEDGDGRAVLYGIGLDRQWRCLSFKGAPALGEKLEQLAINVQQTQGVVLSEDPARPADYGLGTSSMRVISLHGGKMKPTDATSDLIASVDIGAAVIGAEGCYARQHGQRAIWTVDVDPAAICGREPTPRPSLIDPAMVPAGWHGEGPRLQSVTVQLPGRPAAKLTMRNKEVTPEQMEKGEPGFEWVLTTGGPESIAPLQAATSYANYVLQAPWSDIVDPAVAPSLGFDKPRAILTLEGSGPVLHLILGGRTPSGRSAVLCDLNQIAFEIEPAQEALLFPAAEMFAPGAQANPWAPQQAPTLPGSPIPQIPGR